MKYVVRRVVALYKDFEVEASSPEEADKLALDWFAEGTDCDGEAGGTRTEVYDDDCEMLAEYY